MFLEKQNKIRIIALAISILVVVSLVFFFDLADNSIKSYFLCFAFAFGAGFIGLQLMPESVKNPMLFISLHIVTTLAMALLLFFAILIGNYAP